MLGRLYCCSGEAPLPHSGQETGQEAVTTIAVRVTVYLFTFAAVIGIAAAIAWLSLVVAPLDPKQDGLTWLAVALGGLAVAGGVVYLAEKLFNLAKGVAFMLAEILVEKFKKREREIGREEGQENERLVWTAWYRRQQAALRKGVPFDEPPPGHDAENN